MVRGRPSRRPDGLMYFVDRTYPTTTTGGGNIAAFCKWLLSGTVARFGDLPYSDESLAAATAACEADARRAPRRKRLGYGESREVDLSIPPEKICQSGGLVLGGLSRFGSSYFVTCVFAVVKLTPFTS